MRTQLSSGDVRSGGILGYPLQSLYEEVAFVAYHFHWTRDEICDMPHAERKRWVEEIGHLNKAAQEEN